MTTRLHIVVPCELARELEERVGKRGRSAFFTKAAKRELARLRLLLNTTSLSTGTHTITFKAYDDDLDYSVATVEVTID